MAKEEEARKRIERNEAYDQAWLAKEEAKAEERERLLAARLDAEKERERRAEERARERDRAMELSLEQQEAFRVLREKKALDEYRARAKMALQAREGCRAADPLHRHGCCRGERRPATAAEELAIER